MAADSKKLPAPRQGDRQAERADEDQITGEQFQVAFANPRDFRREGRPERGPPELGTADDVVEASRQGFTDGVKATGWAGAGALLLGLASTIGLGAIAQGQARTRRAPAKKK